MAIENVKDDAEEEHQKAVDELVQKVKGTDEVARSTALATLKKEVCNHDKAMNTIPGFLKYLKAYVSDLRDHYDSLEENLFKKQLAEFISFLLIPFAEKEEDSKLAVQYILDGTGGDLADWGEEYIRNLAGLVGKVFHDSEEQEDATVEYSEQLLNLSKKLADFFFDHNDIPSGVDLVIEVDQTGDLVRHVDVANVQRVCEYVMQCANYVLPPEDEELLSVVVKAFVKTKFYTRALRVALRIGKQELLQELFDEATDPMEKKQMCYLLARHRKVVQTEEQGLIDIMSNTGLAERFALIAKDLDLTEAKEPEDVYKSNLVESRGQAKMDSAKQNLASSIVNAFLNAGHGTDKLMTIEDSKWVYMNKEDAQISAVASLGMILMWDVDRGMSEISKYLQTTDNKMVQAGALLAMGILSSNVSNEFEPVLEVVREYIEHEDTFVKTAACLSLGLCYGGTEKEDILDLLLPISSDPGAQLDLVAMSAMALGLVFVGTANQDVAEVILVALTERSEEDLLASTHTRLICVGLAMLFLGCGVQADAMLEALKMLPPKVAKYASLVVKVFAYAGSGNALQVQLLLQECTDKGEEKSEEEKEEERMAKEREAEKDADAEGKEAAKEVDLFDTHGIAALGIALVSFSDELGCDMVFRTYEHLLQFGDEYVRRAVPLALGLLSLSWPRVNVIDTLSRLTHDSDNMVAQGAILSLGLVGAGTNNSRIALLLRQLSAFYAKDPDQLFAVKIGQGLLYLGKGALGVMPLHSERYLLHKNGFAAIAGLLVACLDMKNSVFSSYHFLFYLLSQAIFPRVAVAVGEDEEATLVPALLRVGKAVDTVGLAGDPRRITGFQTQTSPVVVNYGDRAEFADSDYESFAPVVEDVVVTRANPDAKDNQ